MTFHLKKSESPADGVRRVCRERIGAALDGLRQSDRPAAVHGARKEIKKLRAIFRLVRGEIGRDDYRRATKALRRAADRLAATCDAQVTRKAFGKLVGVAGSRQFPGVQRALQKKLRRENRRFQKAGSAALAGQLLRKTERRVEKLKIAATGWAELEPGLKQSYRRGQMAWKLARQEPSPEHFHEWRKPVKFFWCHLWLLCPEWPSSSRALMNRLERLGELLGDEHDLVLLEQFAGKHRAAPVAEAQALNQLIESRRKKLNAAALKLGARLYAETPAAVCARLGKHWDAWRGETGRR